MDVRQYIGARYVTKIYENSLDPSSAEWESGVTYEPLTLVTYLNSSYLSKKDVPGTVGNPAANPDYWVITGAYNGQISVLQSQIDAIVASVTDIGDRTDALEKFTRSPKKVLFISDSYADAVGSLSDGWITPCISVMGLSASDYFIYKQDGAGLANGMFEGLVDSAIAAIDDKNSITDVIIAGGCNDHTYAAATINSAKMSINTKITSNFINAHIWLAMIGGFVKGDARWDLFNKVKYVYDYALTNKVTPILNAHLPMSCHRFFASDGVHPTQSGCDFIGKLVASAVLSNSSLGHFNLGDYPVVTTFTMDAGISGTAGTPFKLGSTSETIQLIMNKQFTVIGTFPCTYNTGMSFTLGTLADGICCNNTLEGNTTFDVDQYVPVTIRGYAGGNGASAICDELAGQLVFYNVSGDNHTVYVDLHIRTGHADKTYTYIEIRPFNVTLAH